MGRALRAAVARRTNGTANVHSGEDGPSERRVWQLQATVGLAEVVDEVPGARVIGPPAGQETVPRWATDGNLAVGSRESHGTIGELLNVGRVHLRLTVRRNSRRKVVDGRRSMINKGIMRNGKE